MTNSAAKLVSDVLLLHLCLLVPTSAGPIEFLSKDAMPRGNLQGLTFQSRIMVPYGPNLYGELPLQNSTDRPWQGYGYGMGAGEEMAFDVQEHYAYVASALGFVTIVDYKDPTQPVLTDYAIGFEEEEIMDIVVCPQQGWVFLSMASRGVIGVYQSVQRQDPQDPTHLMDIPINGGVPSNLLPNSNCTLLAVSNENDEDVAYGTVTLLRDLENIRKGEEPTQTNIAMDFAADDAEAAWDDRYVLSKGLHMPLTKNALEYWDDHSHMADELNFSAVRENYRSSLFLEGEFLAWSSPEEDELLVNLQVNNGLLRIDVPNNRALALAGYGLKDHGQALVDLNKEDKDCRPMTYRNLFALRSPDTIKTLKYNNKMYVLTANEGDDKKFQGFKEQIKGKDLFVNETFGLENVTVPGGKFDDGEYFNSVCEGIDCVNGARMTVGSSSINYELDPSNPTFHRMVLFGGRGWTVYELPEDPDSLLKLVFDSGFEMDWSVWEEFPWAYNAKVDEDFAPTDQMTNHSFWNYDLDKREDLNETSDPNQDGCWDQGDGTPGACPMGSNSTVDSNSPKEGLEIEHIEAGVACGRLFAVMAGEKNSVAWLYDITNIASPDLIQTFHLSPALQKKSPALAYNDGTIGEVDPENFIFLSKEESPSGKAAVLFAGAYSGTLSYWEFDCLEDEDEWKKKNTEASSSPPTFLWMGWVAGAAAISWVLASVM